MPAYKNFQLVGIIQNIFTSYTRSTSKLQIPSMLGELGMPKTFWCDLANGIFFQTSLVISASKKNNKKRVWNTPKTFKICEED